MGRKEPSPIQVILENSERVPPAVLATLRGICGVSEMLLTASKLVVVAAGLISLALSLQAGVEPVLALLRSVATLMAVGFVLWGANWLFARQAVETALAEIEKNDEDAPISTVETSA